VLLRRYVGHAVLAAVGMSALIASSPTAFEVLRSSGAATCSTSASRCRAVANRFDFTRERGDERCQRRQDRIRLTK
jgi:hypothetical protein